VVVLDFVELLSVLVAIVCGVVVDVRTDVGADSSRLQFCLTVVVVAIVVDFVVVTVLVTVVGPGLVSPLLLFSLLGKFVLVGRLLKDSSIFVGGPCVVTSVFLFVRFSRILTKAPLSTLMASAGMFREFSKF
jgi:hypothetical protein